MMMMRRLLCRGYGGGVDIVGVAVMVMEMMEWWVPAAGGRKLAGGGARKNLPCLQTSLRLLLPIRLYLTIQTDHHHGGIPLVNAGEIPKMDPYEEVAQQGHANPLSPAYVPDPIELDDHVEDQPYADDASPTTKSSGYIVDSDTIEEDIEEDSIDYPDEPGTDDEDPEEDDDEDPEEDPSEEHDPEDEDEDPEEDPSEEHELEDEDNKEDESSEDSDETESFEENETATTTPPPRHREARISVRPQTPMTASTLALIDASAARPLPLPPLPLQSPPPINPTYDQAPLGHRAAMIRIRDDIPEEDMPPWRRFVLTAPPPGCDVAERSAAAAARAPRGQYDFVDFVDAVETGQGLICSPGHDARTIARAADRAEDVDYVKSTFYIHLIHHKIFK
ncbi:hypothetical protein Tco_1260677 [Tanacetum coccineum]